MTAPLPEPGWLIANKYRVESVISRGGMGAIFAARHEGTGGRVALKWMLPKLLSERSARERFIREAQLGARIEHPNVVRVFDIGEDRGSLFLVMALLEGESLGARVARGPLPVHEAVRIVHAAASGVAAAHAIGVVHRDLKPDNIYLANMPDGRPPEPKVLDFGISKVRESDGGIDLALTGAGALLGTPHYMAEEQVRNAVDVDARADTYALGVILYECLSGRRPFNGDGFGDLVLQIATETPTPVEQLVPGLDPNLAALTMRAMSRRREARFADAAALVEALSVIRQAGMFGGAAAELPFGAMPGRVGNTPNPYVSAATPSENAPVAWTPYRVNPSSHHVAAGTAPGLTPLRTPTGASAGVEPTPFVASTTTASGESSLPRWVVAGLIVLAVLVLGMGVLAVVLLKRPIEPGPTVQAAQPPVVVPAPAPVDAVPPPSQPVEPQELELDVPALRPADPVLNEPVQAEPSPEVIAPEPTKVSDQVSAPIKRRAGSGSIPRRNVQRPARDAEEGIDPWANDIGKAWELGEEPDAPRRWPSN